MDVQQVLNDLPLRWKTPPEWADQVMRQPLKLLNDHAHLEKKAAANALELLNRWPEPSPPENWVKVMTAVARDEVEHLAIVVRLLARDSGDIPLARTENFLSIGVNYDLPDFRGNGFETVGQRHRAWAFTSSETWGSDVDFSQIYFSSRWNFIKGKRWKFLVRGEAGYSHARVEDILFEIDGRSIEISLTELPNLYRFKAGGSTSVRGYDFESLSSNGIGSNNILTASAEVEYLFRPNWSFAAFFDVGNSFNDTEP